MVSTDDVLKFLGKFLKLLAEFSSPETHLRRHILESKLLHLSVDLTDLDRNLFEADVIIINSTRRLIRFNVLILHKEGLRVILE